MKKGDSGLVVIPTYNEKDNIGNLISGILDGYKNIDVLVVDDNSPDGTAKEVKKIKRYGKRLQLMLRNKKDGRGGAVMDGFREGLKAPEKYKYFFEMDADFSHSPDEISLFLDKIGDYDLVIGSRYMKGSKIVGWPLSRKIFSKFANKYARLLLRIPITDYTNGYRLYRREVLESLSFNAIEKHGYIVLSEVAFQIHLMGYRIGEVPTIFINRERGLSNLTVGEIISAFHSVLRLALRRRHIKKKISVGLL
jgi:dolichol-phosphate mannosyltransferase